MSCGDNLSKGRTEWGQHQEIADPLAHLAMKTAVERLVYARFTCLPLDPNLHLNMSAKSGDRLYSMVTQPKARSVV